MYPQIRVGMDSSSTWKHLLVRTVRLEHSLPLLMPSLVSVVLLLLDLPLMLLLVLVSDLNDRKGI